MVKTLSIMQPLGMKAPEFTLIEPLSNQSKSLQSLASDIATVIMFICNHCPFVKHINLELVRLARDYLPKGISFIAISSNDAINYPQDGPEQMAQQAKKLGYPFPYLYDRTQAVAKSYGAACTPDFFVFNKELRLVYRGQLDDSRPSNDKPNDGRDIRRTLDNLLAGREIDDEQKPSVGCNIKWIEDNAL